jgi:hypothetical protein
LDVILPDLISSAPGGRFIVAAFADDAGATVLASRIRGQFERLLHLRRPRLTVSVSHRMLQSPPRVAGASAEQIVTSMATHLEESIKQLGGCQS